MIVVLAEKPAVARDLAAALGANARRDGYLEGNGYRVTWAIGHLVGLAEPDQINPAWKVWSRATLPIVPEHFPLLALPEGRAQYRVVKQLLTDRATDSVIAATDAGREGELIFRYIYELSRCRKPWQRLWLSSLTPAAIRGAFAALEPGQRYDGLASAARARSQADWLVGMNLSRAYTLTSGTLFSVGRVQTPTLALIIARDREIEQFVPEPYLEVQATFEGPRGSYRGTFYHVAPATLFDDGGGLKAFKPLSARLPADGLLAQQVAERAKVGEASVLAIDRSTRRTPPPLLYDLTELQRHANRLYGYSAKHTLDTAQRLYEVHKALSYPRTDSRHLPASVASTLPAIVDAIAPRYPGLVAADSGERRLGKRFVDDAKVGDHHALIPTAQAPRGLTPGSAEARIYDLVCRRVLMAWHADMIEAVTRLVSEVLTVTARDLYATQGTSVESPGWSVLDPRPAVKRAPDEPPKIPAGLEPGEPQRVIDVVVHRKQTQPPPRFTEATLLTAMETAGKTLDDRALIDAMRDSGLGTPATRAATIETLLSRGYIVREAKNLRGTPLGAALVAAVHPLVRSAEMTGRWELRLRRMERGQEAFEPFMRDIAAYVREVVAVEADKPAAPRQRMAAGARAGTEKDVRGGSASASARRAAQATRAARNHRARSRRPKRNAAAHDVRRRGSSSL